MMWNNDINTVLMMFVLNTICYQQNYVILLRVSSKSRPTCRAGLRVPNKADFNFNKDTLLERMNMIYWGTEYRRCLDSNGPSGCSVWGAPSSFYSLSRGLFVFGLYFVTHAAGGDPSCFTSALFFFLFFLSFLVFPPHFSISVSLFFISSPFFFLVCTSLLVSSDTITLQIQISL